jgi:hypothetical protein
MTATPMTAAEKQDLPVLDFVIPKFGKHANNTQPFNNGSDISKYRINDLLKEETRSDRTDLFSKFVFLITAVRSISE